jgi:hypothetical protein
MRFVKPSLYQFPVVTEQPTNHDDVGLKPTSPMLAN